MVSLLVGGITHHYIGSSLPYCGRINNNNFGTIYNEYVIGMVGSEDFKAGIISGKDSACGNILGPILSKNIYGNLDFVLGGYNTNKEDFRKIGMEAPSIGGITPVIGLNYKVNLYKNNNFKVNLENVMSYGIITHSLSINF